MKLSPRQRAIRDVVEDGYRVHLGTMNHPNDPFIHKTGKHWQVVISIGQYGSTVYESGDFETIIKRFDEL